VNFVTTQLDLVLKIKRKSNKKYKIGAHNDIFLSDMGRVDSDD
jgi:hypothetical protein